MEPVVIGAMGRIAAAVVQRSSAPVKSEVPSPAEWSEEADERGGLILRDGSGEAFAMLTQDQVSQISDFGATRSRGTESVHVHCSPGHEGYRLICVLG